MSLTSMLFQALPGPIQRRLDDRITRFNEWRFVRPFWGGFLLILAGLVIAYVPMQFAAEMALIGGLETVVGLIWAVLVFLCGAFALARPDMARIFGVLGIAMSILSIFGALGGFFVGLLLGIFGGSLCIAWEGPPEGAADPQPTPDLDADEDVQFSWQGEQ